MSPARKPTAPAIPAVKPIAIQGLSRTKSSADAAAILTVSPAFAPALAMALAAVAMVSLTRLPRLQASGAASSATAFNTLLALSCRLSNERILPMKFSWDLIVAFRYRITDAHRAIARLALPKHWQ